MILRREPVAAARNAERDRQDAGIGVERIVAKPVMGEDIGRVVQSRRRGRRGRRR